MTSQKQVEANRKNASVSTGPRSAAGRVVVSQNAVRHGLRAQRVVIEGESQAEFNDFRNRLVALQAPADPLEMLLVDRIAAGFWRLRRTGKIETQMFDQMQQSLYDQWEQTPDKAMRSRLNRDEIAFPSRCRFQTFDETKAAWDATEDGLAFSQGGLSEEQRGDSLKRFIKDSQRPYPEIPPCKFPDVSSFIEAMKKDDPGNQKMLDKLDELEVTLKKFAQMPVEIADVSALRKYLQGLRELMDNSGMLTRQWQVVVDDAITELLYVERQIHQQLQPNPGQTLCQDFKGADTLSKFMRYESQIERGLFKAMHELQRLQAMRRNEPVCPPLAVDVDITADQSPLETDG